MRNLIVGAAVALLACAVPGIAAAKSGYADVYYANGNIDLGGGESDIDAYGVNGVVAFDANALGVQLGAHYGNLDSDDAGDSVDAWSGDAHVYTRNDTWQAGAGVSYTNLDGGTGTDLEEWAVAAEGLYFLDRTTLGATVTYSEADAGAGDDVEVVALDTEARYFVTDNFRVNGGVGFGSADSTGTDGDFWNAGVGAEYQLASAPVSFFGAVEHISLDDSDVDADVVSIGARWNFGGTLFERDRSGANLSKPRGLFGRLFGA